MQAEAAGSAERVSVVAALRNAAAATGSDFHYLLGTAMRESSLRTGAQSTTSSAAGLFQFIDQTWLGLVKEHGAQHGLGQFADAITKGGDGRYHAEAGARDAILALRKDPQFSALMAGEYARSTGNAMRLSLGREVCGGELYAAHFLGPNAACKLIRMAEREPGANAAALFPQAASANRSVFFHSDGTAKTAHEVYDWALRQPGDAGTVRVAALPDITPAAARTTVVSAEQAEIQMLLASVVNWQPGGGQSAFGSLFGNMSGFGKNAPQAQMLSLNPGLLGLLSDSRETNS